jgi:hypothetical protein
MVQGPNVMSLTGIPEVLAVQEMAFRQGQNDHGVSRERLPSSPFARKYDQVWVEFYLKGKACGGTPRTTSTGTHSPSHKNYTWPPLINPYTQDLEHPNGAVDVEWARKICEMALHSMCALIGTVCRREGDWQKIVCDVPAPIKDALMDFEDLSIRYEQLKKMAREATAGGLPISY